ncbi:MAG: rhodanese-like domain-containing protein [Bacteroidota bacterium]
MKQLSYNELQAWQASGREHQLIDVRETSEHQHFNIGGELMPLSSLLQHLDRIQPTQPIIVYCKRGIRSQIAIQRLSGRFPTADFYNLQGGILHLLYP